MGRVAIFDKVSSPEFTPRSSSIALFRNPSTSSSSRASPDNGALGAGATNGDEDDSRSELHLCHAVANVVVFCEQFWHFTGTSHLFIIIVIALAI